MNSYPKIYLYKRIVQAKLFIDNHFSESIDVNNIADEACFSKFHFIRLFKNIYSKTPYRYLNEVRISNAKKFLEQNNPVLTTCYSVGFESVSAFNALFKKLVHKTPSQYQQLYLQRQRAIKQKPLQFIPNCFALQNGFLEKSNFQEVE